MRGAVPRGGLANMEGGHARWTPMREQLIGTTGSEKVGQEDGSVIIDAISPAIMVTYIQLHSKVSKYLYSKINGKDAKERKSKEKPRETPKTKGDLKWLLGYSKRQRDDVVKNIYEKDYTFRRMLLEAVVHRRRESNEYWGDQVLPKPDLPP
ncbi:Hypp6489 [Branchiostoma lanceolatum]|uniref:Hypp6489 protein n=1 Tax=Branchiostoma lanceolatum TaxID=7740 RepID=A0A8J9YUY0_BRALA|nr:Hypp6489 [Branchiostoma lanceolatum]